MCMPQVLRLSLCIVNDPAPILLLRILVRIITEEIRRDHRGNLTLSIIKYLDSHARGEALTSGSSDVDIYFLVGMFI